LQIPLLHIADPTAEAVKSRGIDNVALLGTRFTMQEDFYRGKLSADHGLTVMLPDAAEMDAVHDIIFQELCLGKVRTPSRERYLAIVDRLVSEGAEGVILGCTEIGMLIQDGDRHVPFFDTTELHARAAVDYALKP
jgi:aspartate racemase